LGRLGAMLVAVHYEMDRQRFIAPGPGTETGYGGFLVSQMKQRDAVVLVAERDGEVLGYAYGGLEGNDWLALRGPAGVIHDLLVDPAHRGQGVGRALLEAAVQALISGGAPRVVLSTAERNEGAQRLFASAGFRRTMIEMTREADSAG
jgi:ribosomal protein S18 acetylase RimI-like enzyme